MHPFFVFERGVVSANTSPFIGGRRHWLSPRVIEPPESTSFGMYTEINKGGLFFVLGACSSHSGFVSCRRFAFVGAISPLLDVVVLCAFVFCFSFPPREAFFPFPIFFSSTLSKVFLHPSVF